MKGQNELQYKHAFTITDGRIYWDKPDLLRAKLFMLENKRGYAIITMEEDKPSSNQWAFYWGGIINGECMHSNCFLGLNEKEVHHILFSELRSYTRGVTITKKDGEEMHIQKEFIDDFSTYSKKKLSEYIEQLIPHLKNDYGIIIKDSKDYQYNKFHLKKKE